MGYHGIASEILIAFSARFDAALAAQKSLVMAMILLPILLPISWMMSSWSEARLLARDARRVLRRPSRSLAGFMVLACSTLCFALLFPAFAGLIRPLKTPQAADSFHYALTVLKQSAPTTLRYACTAALVATTLGLILTLTAGRKHFIRSGFLLFSLLFLSLPSSLHALGFASLASELSKSFDWFTRRGNAVGIALGLRLLPIPLLFCLRAWSLMPESSHQVAEVHGVPPLLFHWKVSLPRLLPAILASLLLVALLAVADVSSTLLLLPPGASTFTSRIFSVIDNTTERMLSALCLVYMASGFVLLAVSSLVQAQWHRRSGV